MKDLMGPANRAVLEEFATRRALIAFDFDGTLAPIVAQREAARLQAATSRLLARLAALYPVAVISGRARADVARRVAGVGVRYVVGSHGVEPFSATRASVTALDEARRALVELVRRQPELDLEDKRYSLAVHYRRARRPSSARESILATVTSLKWPVRASGGKRVVNVVPADSPDKGGAMLALTERERAERALFLGDDVTDEDVFCLADERLLLVRVGRSAQSAAAYFVRNQGAVDGLLRILIKLREKAAR